MDLCDGRQSSVRLNLLRLQPDAAFSVNWTAYMIFAVIIGGVGSIEGPIIGAVLFTVLQQTLSRYGAWYLVALGMVAILVTVWARRGLWGAVSDRLGFSFFPTRRHLDLPAGPRTEGSTVRAVAGTGDG